MFFGSGQIRTAVYTRHFSFFCKSDRDCMSLSPCNINKIGQVIFACGIIVFQI